MLNEIRAVFRRSIEAFRSELGSREPEDQIADLLGSMRRELVAARAAIPEFEADISRVAADLARESDALAQCERRGAMAERIGDIETRRVAAEFAGRHQARIGVLEQRLAAAQAELGLRRREADEMRLRYQEAETNRFALLAQLKGAAARETMRRNLSDDEGPMNDWSRMEERVEQGRSYVDALGDLDIDSPPPPPRVSQEVLDERLRELKRRMGQE